MSRSDATAMEDAVARRGGFIDGEQLTEMVDTTMDPTRPRTYGAPVTSDSL